MKNFIFLLLAIASGTAAAQSNPVVRLRGSIESFNPPQLVIKERSGKSITLTVPEEAGLRK